MEVYRNKKGKNYLQRGADTSMDSNIWHMSTFKVSKQGNNSAASKFCMSTIHTKL